MLASLLMLAENGPSPFTLGIVSPEKVVFFLAGKLLSIVFSGLRLEAQGRAPRQAVSGWIQGGSVKIARSLGTPFRE